MKCVSVIFFVVCMSISIGYARTPNSFVVANFDTRQANRLQGRAHAETRKIRAEARALRLDEALVRSDIPLGRKMLRLSYNAEHGEVSYRIEFKKRRSVQEYNAIGVYAKGDPSRIQWVLSAGEDKYVFDFAALTGDMVEYIIPFSAFNDFPSAVPPLDALTFTIVGDEQKGDAVAGELFLDNLTLYRYHKDHIDAAVDTAKTYGYKE